MKDKEIYKKISEWVKPLVAKWDKDYPSRIYDEFGREFAICEICEERFDWWENMYCPACQSCPQCSATKLACMCYTPRTARNEVEA